MSDPNSFDPESEESRKALDGFLEQEELRDLIDDNPGLELLQKFGQSLERIPWFSRVGFPLDEREEALALDYLMGLGMPEAMPAVVESFADAALVAENPEVDSAAWDMEEQLRAALTGEALQFMEEEILSIMLTQISNVAAEIIDGAAREAAAMDFEEGDEEDEELLKAMVGSAVQACHQAALVLAAGPEDEHAFSAKFGLFEAGRWPISISGSSFNIY